jgi:H+/Cl- antiporter ClcA
MASEQWQQWWQKSRRTLITVAALGIVADASGLYFLFVTSYTGSFLFRLVFPVLAGALTGLAAIEIFAFFPNLWPKLASLLGERILKNRTRPPTYRPTLAFNILSLVALSVFALAATSSDAIQSAAYFEPLLSSIIFMVLVSFVFFTVALIRTVRDRRHRTISFEQKLLLNAVSQENSSS